VNKITSQIEKEKFEAQSLANETLNYELEKNNLKKDKKKKLT